MIVSLQPEQVRGKERLGGSVVAAAHLGQLYSGAHEFARRRTEAIRWRRVAAQGGHVSALFALTSDLPGSGDPAQENRPEAHED